MFFKDGDTAIHIAFKNKFVEAVGLLIKGGADLNVKNRVISFFYKKCISIYYIYNSLGWN